MRAVNPSALRTGALVGLAVSAAVAAPAACLFPSYTFDLKGTGGSGGSSSPSSSSPSSSVVTASATTSTTSTTTSTTSTTSGGGSGGMGGAGTGGMMATSTTTSSTSVSSSTGGVGEVCDNGIDDNGDGKVDCADPGCQATWACVSTVPAGWQGYYALYDGAPAADPGCPNEFPGSTNSFLGNGGLNAPPANCTACGCTSPTGQTCQAPTEVDVFDSACGQNGTCAAQFTEPAWDGSCHGNGFSGGTTCGPTANMTCSVNTGAPCSVSVAAPAPTVIGGSCTATGGTPDVPAISWARLGRGCGDPQNGQAKGCNAGKVCMPKTQAPYATGICIMSPGDNVCPNGQFSQKHLFSGNNTADTRTCTSCNCAAPTGATCNATISIYSDLFVNTCNTLVTTFQAGTCANLVGDPTVAGHKAALTQPAGGSCQMSGGQPTGMVTPGVSTTFCCIP